MRASLIHALGISALALAFGCSGGAPEPSAPLEMPADPTPTPSWDWILQIEGAPSPPPQVDYLGLDAFDTPAAYVALVRARSIQPICYLSIATAETFRPDFATFAAIPGVLGNPYPGFEDERFLDLNRWPSFVAVMQARLELCRSKGFMFVEFDNMDAFETPAAETGFQVSEQTALAYIRDLAGRTAALGMAPLQKNTAGLTPQLASMFAGAIFEECVRENFCGAAAPYRRLGKPVLNAEYPQSWEGRFDRAKVCTVSAREGVATIITGVALDRPADDRC